MAVPYLPNLEPFFAAGINPKTGLPLKFDGSIGCALKENIRKNLRIMDEQNAVNRFTWHNLPSGLTGQLLERILYYKGQGMFFYMEANKQFFFLPYCLDGQIDVYGHYLGVTPVPFMGSTNTSKDNDKPKPWIVGLTKNVKYDVVTDDELDISVFNDSCVLLHDYTPQISQINIPRWQLQEPILDVMSDCVAFMRTSLLNSTGVQGVRVTSEDEQSNVKAASRSLDHAAKVGDKWIPIVGGVDFQELTKEGTANAEEFLLALQSLDNLRLSMLGLDSGGLFQKRSHLLESEQEMNQGNAGLIMDDGLQNRIRFADIVNSIWGLGIYPEINETITNMDNNMDGKIQGNDESVPAEEGDTGNE